jgi:hypothetical protein
LLLLPALGHGEPTQVLPLSGMGEKGEAPVFWDFRLDAGRGSGQWTRIEVPSCWEQQGFGAYYYGTQGRGKPDDDPVIPHETATYRREFQVPATWHGRAIFIVFEAVMTDTSVLVNGKPAGPTHQGGFYRFSYDITPLIRDGDNLIEVRVSKESANKSVNTAERRGDYWTFGGIYRPVWLEARPRHHIDRMAIDARADGTFSAQAHLNAVPPPGARLQGQIIDSAGNSVGAPLDSGPIVGDTALLKAKMASPASWTAETPNLYTLKLSLRVGENSLHELTQRFGFRTLEVRPRDGVYLNGSKIVLKGINRHSFDPDTGRTLTREQNYADVRLIKAANMNAVRMSHYPPDPSFLEAADELGLYVLDELAGWQGSYDTPTGARLIGQLVRRDVNHPSILFWDNGNEGGWNTDNDGEFDVYDPQRRPVLHPWAIHGGINTDHYENYDSTVHLSAGPEIFMPTEFLHGLYDGGIGAGFRDYWDVMGRSPTVAGGFFWAFVDEGVARSDQNGRIDNMGNAAPDGMLGPHREKEGSYFAVQEIWSPVIIADLRFAAGSLQMRLENHYDFNDLARCRLKWRALRLPAPGSPAPPLELAAGSARAPTLSPHTSRRWEMNIGLPELQANDVLEVTALGPSAEQLWTWTVRGQAVVPSQRLAQRPVVRKGPIVEGGGYQLKFDLATGRLLQLTNGGTTLPLSGPRLAAWQREPKSRTFRDVAGTSKLLRLQLAPPNEPATLARAEYDGNLREVAWKLRNGELVFEYRIDWNDSADILGVQFDFPEELVTGKRWVGAGPYRIWKNRQAGTVFGLHATNYSRSIPGETYLYPEFEGYFGAWDWLAMDTRNATVTFRNAGAIPFFGLYRPTPVDKPLLELPDVGWSFLNAVPPIGTKFALPDLLGPLSQPAQFNGTIRGELGLSVAP